MTSKELFDSLSQALARWPVTIAADTRFAVALSGGLDSTFLLALMVRAGLGRQVRAIHIDHSLHADSSSWQDFCEQLANGLDVPFATTRIEIDTRNSRRSVEELAREQRYRALAGRMHAGEILLTAHHANDQLETLLFRLVRGSGVRGMRGILSFQNFGPGYLARPLLGFTRDTIAAHAAEWRLSWIDDPSNRDVRFDRNFLRSQIVPKLLEHWHKAPEAAVRLADSMSEAEAILEDVARSDSAELLDFERIPRSALRALTASRAGNLLRFVIRELGLPLPSAAQMAGLIASFEITRPDAGTLIGWAGAEARTHRDHLYLQKPLTPLPARAGHGRITPARGWRGSVGELRLERAGAVGLPDAWVEKGLELRFRVGGERFKLLNTQHERPLKKWFQEAGIVPWMRDRIPLLVHDSVIVAVGDFWLSDAVLDAGRADPVWQVRWSGHPRLY